MKSAKENNIFNYFLVGQKMHINGVHSGGGHAHFSHMNSSNNNNMESTDDELLPSLPVC